MTAQDEPTLRLIDVGSCRICGDRANLFVSPSRYGSQFYIYCARCVNRALERAEVKA